MAFSTGSRLGRAMECVGSAVLSRVSEESEAGTAGRWKHLFLEAVKNKTPLEDALNVVPPEYREACASLDVEAVEGLDELQPELELAYDVRTRKARAGIAPEATEYSEVYARTDLGGLMHAGDEPIVCVIDVKTGHRDVEPARTNWQLLSAAVALSVQHGVSRARVAVLYLRENARARWDIADLDGLDLDTSAAAMEQLLERVERARKNKADAPPVRMGEWCRYCPSKLYCPAHTGLIKLFAVDQAGAVAGIKALLTPELAREAKAKADLVRAALKNLDNALYSYARDIGGIALGDGRKWGPHVVEKDDLNDELAYETLKGDYGLEVAIAASKFEVTKKGIGDAMRLVQKSVVDAGGKKPTLKELEAQAFGRLRSVGALNKVEKEVFEEYRTDDVSAATPPSPEV